MAHKIETSLTGAAGEHLVLSRLLSRGVLAAQAPRGARTADILVNFLDEKKKPILIQVKSRQYGSDGGWHMSEKHETQVQEDLIFCFVDFERQSPSVHVIPARIVASVIKTDHEIWLSQPGRNGQAHNPNPMRRIRPASNGMEPAWLDEYLEAWNLILGE
jgi:hypothetical protein